MKWGKETEYMITVDFGDKDEKSFMYSIEEDGQIEYKFDKKDPDLIHF